jgi:hypothetical protein
MIFLAPGYVSVGPVTRGSVEGIKTVSDLSLQDRVNKRSSPADETVLFMEQTNKRAEFSSDIKITVP